MYRLAILEFVASNGLSASFPIPLKLSIILLLFHGIVMKATSSELIKIGLVYISIFLQLLSLGRKYDNLNTGAELGAYIVLYP